MQQLVSLDLRMNELLGIIPHSLANLDFLSSLNLSYNNLSGEIPMGNQIQTLDPSIYIGNAYLCGSSLNKIIQTIGAYSCLQTERDALLEFKASINDPFHRLASWRGEDCCTWAGIKCSNQTGHVVKLNLINPSYDWSTNSLSGEISPSLQALTDLKHLDLSNNNFSGSTFPKFICSFSKLEYLNLSLMGLSGMIPSQISNLSRLQYLDLNNIGYPFSYFTWSSNYVADIWCLSHLNSLKFLDISGVNLHDSREWVQALNMLPSLETLYLLGNYLATIPISLPIVNFSSLTTLYLADQNFNTLIPAWIGQLTSLTDLVLWNCSIIDLEYSTKPLSSLRSIDLSENNLTGKIPQNITALLGLTNLNLSNNHLCGTIPMEIGKMLSMESLDLRMNNLSGMIPNSLAILNFLTTLNLSYNNLSGEIPTGDQLQTLDDLYSYIGNAYLCGPPLNKSCNNGTFVRGYSTTSDDELEKVFLYLFVVLGFVFGFWLFFGVLMFKRKWRYRFFKIVDNMFDRIYAFVMLYFARFRGDASK
ncbi:hypothetical protein LUZ60_009868 [Juncus effusus]|nr:hypothetical protein LUZ60_009868 [Juncus effusus]